MTPRRHDLDQTVIRFAGRDWVATDVVKGGAAMAAALVALLVGLTVWRPGGMVAIILALAAIGLAKGNPRWRR